ncbi:helix-turn-helix domain-containing protein [Roseococcus sp. SDR]|uniref:helix-turn-helix domain-containing protein n=1 Tax=Roseococcus sp. SDR TaxID=2835532 RepID=UPI0020C17973|nr:helix-turn-helix transcriptional regulator [Roseococcus sp. SDR]
MELRREAGLWLRELREHAKLSQRALAEKVGLDYYTFVSQIEAGRGRIPPDKYLAWAIAVGMEPAAFVRNILRFYEPGTYDILFPQES